MSPLVDATKGHHWLTLPKVTYSLIIPRIPFSLTLRNFTFRTTPSRVNLQKNHIQWSPFDDVNKGQLQFNLTIDSIYSNTTTFSISNNTIKSKSLDFHYRRSPLVDATKGHLQINHTKDSIQSNTTTFSNQNNTLKSKSLD